jgi:glycosyltransferase involved in cell wall biosynthesis
MQKKKILYCFAGRSIFGFRDIEMLKTKFDVKVSHYDIEKNVLKKLFAYVRYNFDVLFKIFNIDTVIINFGAWHTVLPVFLAKLSGKKSIIIVGGFDAGNIPSLQYGIFHKPSVLQWFMRITYNAATYLCPVSEGLVSSVNKYADPSGEGYKIGLLHHVPEVRNKVHVIPTDYDDDFWKIDESIFKEGVLALAYVYNSATHTLKGFDLLTECALMMPDVRFTFVGFSPEMIEKYTPDLPENVMLISFVSDLEARKLYQSHKVFVLPSLTEGLPNTLCEAMLCGCIPIVSEVSVMPEIVSNLGFVLKRKENIVLKNLTEKTLECNINIWKIRQRIVEMYPRGMRLALLQTLIKN